MERKSRQRARSSAYPEEPARRKTPLVICLIGAFIFFVIFFTTSTVESAAKGAASYLPHGLPKPKLPSLSAHNPFSQAAHKPPVQANSTSGDSSWLSDWKWLHPFSSTITADEDRAVLPHLKERPPIYTFYTAANKDDAVRSAENKLLLIWRRAWWAQGFKPIILGPAEALKNPLYENVQRENLTTSLEAELMRWLAWSHMGDGILANWLALPMATYDQPLLTYLRKGQYPFLVRYDNFGNGVFSGGKKDIDSVIRAVLKSPSLSTEKTVIDAVPEHPEIFHIDPHPKGVALYSDEELKNNYKDVHDALKNSLSSGLFLLADLITSHLHTTFLSSYSSGLAVLAPHAGNTTILATRGLALASALNACTDSPHPCPPNNPHCKPCAPVPITYPSSLPNSTTTFTIGTVPHPYTLALLLLPEAVELTVPYIRRKTERDPWIAATTYDTLPHGLSGYHRIVSFKEDVASLTSGSATRSIWLIAETDWSWRDLEWHLGFSLPTAQNKQTIAIETPNVADYPDILKPMLSKMNHKPTASEVVNQAALLKKATAVLEKNSRSTKDSLDLRKVLEAWHLADGEAWKFVRALEAREGVERMKWEEQERNFGGAES